MTRSKNSQPTQITHSLESSSRNPINVIIHNGSSVESGGTSICNGVRGGESSKPIADPVGVTGPDENLDAGLDYGGESGEEGAGIYFSHVRYFISEEMKGKEGH